MTRRFNDARHLVEITLSQEERLGDALALRYLETGDADGPERTVTFAMLARRARAIGAVLREVGAVGARAILLYPPGADFHAAFFGTLFGGAVAVPTFPPDPSQMKRTLARLRHIVRDSGAEVVLTTAFVAEAAKLLLTQVPELSGLRLIATDTLDDATGEGFLPPRITEDTLALLQYTSGSTSDPRGAMITHGSLLANERAVASMCPVGEGSNTVGWLPLHHDMGLMGGVIMPMTLGACCTYMSPMAFLERPARWVRALSRYAGRITGAPNFAYALTVRRTSEQERDALDLSSLDVILNGAEPINTEDARRFFSYFAPAGLRATSHFPSYGLAESTVFVSTVKREEETPSLSLDVAALREGRALVPPRGALGTRRIASCGALAEGHTLRIVCPERREPLADAHVGEIWVSGPSVASGYWNRPEESAEAFRAHLTSGEGPYLRTGDLGFLRDGELYVTGRRKDLVVIRGANHMPQDIELTVQESSPLVRPGCVAAFSVEVEGEEQLVVAAEVGRMPTSGVMAPELSSITALVREHVAREHGVRVHAVSLLAPRSIPKTTSGKIMRHACRRDFLAGTSEALYTWLDEAPRHDDVRVDAQARGEGEVLMLLQSALAAVLRRPIVTISPSASLQTLGLDSLMLVELRQTLGAELGRDVSPSMVALPSIAEIARALAQAPAARAPEHARTNVFPPSAEPRRGREKLRARMTPALARAGAIRSAGMSYFERPVAALDAQWVECMDGKRQLMFATYNYLGLLGHPRIERAAIAAVTRYGTGTHGVRLLGGSLDLHQRLERRIAEFTGRDAAITFSSGFMTNFATISTLVGPGDYILADQLNHASIVEGCLASGATFRVYRHNDMEDLEALLAAVPDGATALVIADAVFSLDGDIVDLPKLVALCKQYGAVSMIDEAHSLGVLGATGRGIEEHFDMPGAIDVKMGTLSKAIPACGGYIAGDAELIDFLRITARGYVFSAAMPPAVAAAALAAFDVLEDEVVARRALLERNASYFIAGLRAAGFDTGASCSPIVPVIVGSDERALALTKYCQERGLFVLPALPPAVPVGTARLRLNVTASHTMKDIDHALDVLVAAKRAVLDLPRVLTESIGQ